MAAIAASGVTYTLSGKGPGIVDSNGIRQNGVKIVFGDGASTYPSGGIPLSGLSAWGFPNTVGEVYLTDMSNGDGYIYKWDKTNNKLRIYYPTATHTHDLLLKNAAVADGATTRVNAGANLLGANTGSNITVTGGGANGGVVALAGVPGGEVSTSFVPASNVTIYATVRGK